MAARPSSRPSGSSGRSINFPVTENKTFVTRAVVERLGRFLAFSDGSIYTGEMGEEQLILKFNDVLNALTNL